MPMLKSLDTSVIVSVNPDNTTQHKAATAAALLQSAICPTEKTATSVRVVLEQSKDVVNTFLTAIERRQATVFVVGRGRPDNTDSMTFKILESLTIPMLWG